MQVEKTEANWEGSKLGPGNAWAALTVYIGDVGPGRHNQQQKARGAQNGPEQQRSREKRANA